MSTFADSIDTAIKGATKNDEGKTVYPEGTDDNVIHAAGLEQRRRDTQSALTKEKESTTRLTAENTKLADSWQQDVAKTLTSDQRTELEELKHTDPEAWRSKLNTYEAENVAEFGKRRKTIAVDAGKETEEQSRKRLLEEHNLANPTHALTDDVIENDLPPRILKKLEKGDITFAEFLDEANIYLGKKKVVAGDPNAKAPNSPDLSDAGGSDKPTKESVEKSATESYKGEIY